MINSALIFSIFSITLIQCTKINHLELKCLVCEASLNELQTAVNKIDPSSSISVGGFQLDNEGNYKSKQVPKSKSELQLSELMEELCEKMENYVRATWKSNGSLTLFNMIDPSGAMNSKMSEVDIIQDGDLNESLKYYCDSILGENEESIIQHFQQENAGNFCKNAEICASTPTDTKSEL